MLTYHLARLVQLLDTYVVHTRTTVDTRLRVRLRDDQGRPKQRSCPQIGGQLVERLRFPDRGIPLAPQNPQSRAALDAHQAPTVRGPAQVVAAVAEKDEAFVRQPAQEGTDLLRLGTALGEP